MKSGAYGIFSLDGRPLEPRDIAILFQGSKPAVFDGEQIALGGQDEKPSSIAIKRSAERIDLLMGSLVGEEECAEMLGLDRSCDQIEVAIAACERWGADASIKLLGEWSLVTWMLDAGEVSITLSECARDDCYFAVGKGVVAIAPDLLRLSKLPWVGCEIDGDALMRSLARPSLSHGIKERTFLKKVHRAKPEHRVSVSKRGVTIAAATHPSAPSLRSISFDQAIEEIDDLLRLIVAERIADEADVAVLLSGGLDSSLIAALTVEASRNGQRVHLLCSAAPEGSGLPDELEWAQLAASALGLPITPVPPAPGINAYLPTERFFSHAGSPLISPRHYLYEALEDAAFERSAHVLMDGAYGELTVSHYGLPAHGWLARAKDLARGFSRMRASRDLPDTEFHVMPAQKGLAEMRSFAATDPQTLRSSMNGGQIGYETGREKVGRATSATSLPAVRGFMPFRDRRLIDLVASLPSSFPRHDGAPRAIVRALLQKRMPPAIANRHCKMAFSPSYDLHLKEDAAQARARIPLQQEAGAGNWVDLKQLAETLSESERNQAFRERQGFRIQATAMVAEFFRWWNDQETE